MTNEVEKLLMDFQKYHSEFQIDNFIVGAEVDDWARYKQCLREINSRSLQIKSLDQKVELARLELKALKRTRFFCFSKLQKLKHKFRVENGIRAIKENRNEAQELDRELKRFLELAIELKKQFENLTPEKRSDLEARSWFSKARRLVLIDSICNGGTPTERTVDFILSLPIEMQNEILIEYQSKGRALANDRR
jgi:hypothetical protein